MSEAEIERVSENAGAEPDRFRAVIDAFMEAEADGVVHPYEVVQISEAAEVPLENVLSSMAVAGLAEFSDGRGAGGSQWNGVHTFEGPLTPARWQDIVQTLDGSRAGTDGYGGQVTDAPAFGDPTRPLAGGVGAHPPHGRVHAPVRRRPP